MSDQRPDDIDLTERSSLPPDLATIADRLTVDGERWRRHAPDGAGLPAWTRATLDERDTAPGGTDGADHILLAPRRLERYGDDRSPSSGLESSQRDMRTLTSSRARSALGVAAAVVVVGLIALLLTQNAYRRTNKTGTSSEATATVAVMNTPVAPNLTFLQPGQLPVVSASDPSVVYKLANGALQRSADGGKTYGAVTLPKTDLSQIDDTSVAISPLDASHVFVSYSGKKDSQVCPGMATYPVIVMHGGIDAGGYIPCAEEYVSADGGHTWTQPKLPYRGALGGLNSYRAATTGPLEDSQYTFKASGARLYSALAFDNMGGSLADSPGVRLVASDDSGLTWTLIDSALATPSRYICDFGVGAASGVIYAVTGDNACGGMNYPKLTLWVSVNGGQRWSVVQALPTLAETGVFVGAHGELYLYEPQVTVVGRGASSTATPADLKVSVNQGASFTSAPSAGLSASTALTGPYATLADGSIVCAVAGAVNGTVSPMTLYAWKPGASSWRTLAPSIPGGVTAVTPLAPAAGATEQTLLVADEAGNLMRVKVPLGQ